VDCFVRFAPRNDGLAYSFGRSFLARLRGEVT